MRFLVSAKRYGISAWKNGSKLFHLIVLTSSNDLRHLSSITSGYRASERAIGVLLYRCIPLTKYCCASQECEWTDILIARFHAWSFQARTRKAILSCTLPRCVHPEAQVDSFRVDSGAIHVDICDLFKALHKSDFATHFR